MKGKRDAGDGFSQGRRRVLKQGALGLAWAAAVGAIARTAQAQGQEKPQKVDSGSQLAMALHYTTDATTAPATLRMPNSFCHNCRFFQGQETTGYAPCQVFSGKLVDAKGWCSSWSAKQQGGG